MDVVSKNTTEVLTITSKGYAKRTPISEFGAGTRATKGGAICKFKEENDYLADMALLTDQKEVIVNSKLSSLKLMISNIPSQGKATMGVQTIKMLGNNLVNNLILLEK